MPLTQPTDLANQSGCLEVLKAKGRELEKLECHHGHDDFQPVEADFCGCHSFVAALVGVLRRQVDKVFRQQVGEELHEQQDVFELVLLRLFAHAPFPRVYFWAPGSGPTLGQCHET